MPQERVADDLVKLVKDAKTRYEALSPIERAVHDLLQRRSGTIGLSRMSLPREVIVDQIDKQPEYVLLKAYEELRESLRLSEARRAGMERVVEAARHIRKQMQSGVLFADLWRLHEPLDAIDSPSSKPEGNQNGK